MHSSIGGMHSPTGTADAEVPVRAAAGGLGVGVTRRGQAGIGSDRPLVHAPGRDAPHSASFDKRVFGSLSN
jgi:hypothetical protein